MGTRAPCHYEHPLRKLILAARAINLLFTIDHTFGEILKESFTGYHFKQALFYNADENMDEGKVKKFKDQDKIPT